MRVVIIFEPAKPGEPNLTLSEQTNDVIGPFDSDEAAMAWIDIYQTGGDGFCYLITEISSPTSIKSGRKLN